MQKNSPRKTNSTLKVRPQTNRQTTGARKGGEPCPATVCGSHLDTHARDLLYTTATTTTSTLLSIISVILGVKPCFFSCFLSLLKSRRHRYRTHHNDQREQWTRSASQVDSQVDSTWAGLLFGGPLFSHIPGQPSFPSSSSNFGRR